MDIYDRAIGIYINQFIKFINDKAWKELLILCEKKDIVFEKGRQP